MFYRVTLKDVKSFLPRVHCKISTSKLRELFQEVDTKKRNELSFDEFSTLYKKLICLHFIRFSMNVFQCTVHLTTRSMSVISPDF